MNDLGQFEHGEHFCPLGRFTKIPGKVRKRQFKVFGFVFLLITSLLLGAHSCTPNRLFLLAWRIFVPNFKSIRFWQENASPFKVLRRNSMRKWEGMSFRSLPFSCYLLPTWPGERVYPVWAHAISSFSSLCRRKKRPRPTVDLLTKWENGELLQMTITLRGVDRFQKSKQIWKFDAGAIHVVRVSCPGFTNPKTTCGLYPYVNIKWMDHISDRLRKDEAIFLKDATSEF